MLSNPSPIPFFITFTRARDAAGGNVDYHGIPFQPRCLIAWQTTTTGIGSTGQVTDVGTDLGVVFISGANYMRTNLIQNSTNVDNTEQVAKLAAYLADGFTLTWTKTGSPSAATMNITVLAFP
jgi:hypothetical protein